MKNRIFILLVIGTLAVQGYAETASPSIDDSAEYKMGAADYLRGVNSNEAYYFTGFSYGLYTAITFGPFPIPAFCPEKGTPIKDLAKIAAENILAAADGQSAATTAIVSWQQKYPCD